MPEQIEEQALNPNTGKYFSAAYDFHPEIKVKEDRDRSEKFDSKIDRHKKQLGDDLEIGEKVLLLAERLRKRDAPGRLYKSTTENKSFLNTDRIFKISERSKLNNNFYLYWLKENGRNIKNRFLREELFALKHQFVE